MEYLGTLRSAMATTLYEKNILKKMNKKHLLEWDQICKGVGISFSPL